VPEVAPAAAASRTKSEDEVALSTQCIGQSAVGFIKGEKPPLLARHHQRNACCFGRTKKAPKPCE